MDSTPPRKQRRRTAPHPDGAQFHTPPADVGGAMGAQAPPPAPRKRSPHLAGLDRSLSPPDPPCIELFPEGNEEEGEDVAMSQSPPKRARRTLPSGLDREPLRAEGLHEYTTRDEIRAVVRDIFDEIQREGPRARRGDALPSPPADDVTLTAERRTLRARFLRDTEREDTPPGLARFADFTTRPLYTFRLSARLGDWLRTDWSENGSEAVRTAPGVLAKVRKRRSPSAAAPAPAKKGPHLPPKIMSCMTTWSSVGSTDVAPHACDDAAFIWLVMDGVRAYFARTRHAVLVRRYHNATRLDRVVAAVQTHIVTNYAKEVHVSRAARCGTAAAPTQSVPLAAAHATLRQTELARRRKLAAEPTHGPLADWRAWAIAQADGVGFERTEVAPKLQAAVRAILAYDDDAYERATGMDLAARGEPNEVRNVWYRVLQDAGFEMGNHYERALARGAFDEAVEDVALLVAPEAMPHWPPLGIGATTFAPRREVEWGDINFPQFIGMVDHVKILLGAKRVGLYRQIRAQSPLVASLLRDGFGPALHRIASTVLKNAGGVSAPLPQSP